LNLNVALTTVLRTNVLHCDNNNASIYKARNASRNAESKALEKQTLEALAILCSVVVAAVRRF